MTQVSALSASSATSPLTPSVIERREPRAHDVVIDIQFAGICHSDIHQVRNEWGNASYPMVPGHEIAGVVTAIGSEVTTYKVGDRAGIGCFVDSCRECENCLSGEEQYCLKGMTGTYNGKDRVTHEPTFGGYSTQIVADEKYVLRIPESIDMADAAPLLCAGITLYSPLKHWQAGPGKRVAILGMGGLGHMGVKIAHALGAEVTVLSQTLSKKDDGLRMGADHYYATSDPHTFRELRDHFDLILNTVSANLDVDAYLSLLRLDGSLVNIGIPSAPDSVRMFSLASRRRSLSATNIGGIRETQEMLDFCAEHGIAAEVEVISADEVNEAYERVIASKVRYRAVIDISTMPSVESLQK